MMVRLRTLAMVALPVLVIGGGIWMFAAGTPNGPVGAGGLPLIKADTNPVKLPPDDPGGEIMPNADSTVFSAMGSNGEADPSMENLRLPEIPKAEPPAVTADFAGLKTGFTVPAEPQERKVESLFETEPKPANTAPEMPPASRYNSGIAPNALEEDAREEKTAEAAPVPEPVAEPVQEPVVARPEPEKPAAPVKAPEPKKAAPKPDVSAQAMEAEEKAITARAPVAPAAKPVAAPKPVEAKKETPRPPVTAPTAAENVAKDVANEAYIPPKRTPAAPVAAPVKQAETPAAGGFYIQLSSMPAGSDANAMWARLRGMYPAALSGLTPSYQQAQIPGKGNYIRIQAGPLTQAEANNRCRTLRSVDPNGGCLVVRR